MSVEIPGFRLGYDCVLVNIDPLNAELNPICHLLALTRAHPILHVSRIRVKLQVKLGGIYIHADYVFLLVDKLPFLVQ